MSPKLSQKLKEVCKWASMAHFHENPNFNSILIALFHIGFHSLIQIWSCWFNADFQLPPLHHSPYPCIWLVFVIVIDIENPNHQESSHQEWPSSPPSSPDYQLPSPATVHGGEVADKTMIVGTGKQRHQGGGGGGEEEKEETRVLMRPRWSHVVFCMGAACFCFILISILLALPSCVYVGLVLLCLVPSMHEILNITMVTSLSFTTTVRKLTCCSLSLPNSPQLFLAQELYDSQWGAKYLW